MKQLSHTTIEQCNHETIEPYNNQAIEQSNRETMKKLLILSLVTLIFIGSSAVPLHASDTKITTNEHSILIEGLQDSYEITDHPQLTLTRQDLPQPVWNRVWNWGRNLFTQSSPQPALSQQVQVKVTHATGQQIENQVIQTTSPDPDHVEIILDPNVGIPPGKYTIEITYGDQTSSQDFLWGVLAINPTQSPYAPGDAANIHFGVLDDQGAIVCNAELTLTITPPDNTPPTTITTQEGTIITNDTCGTTELTLNPDYQTTYDIPQTTGTYWLQLSATTSNGTHTVTDSFEVTTDSPFVIKRNTATRLYPLNIYPQTFTIIAKQDFSGIITESLPSSFDISNISNNGTIKQWNNRTQITWDVELKSGDSTNLSYDYDAPDISPQFYLLGPLTFHQFGHEAIEQLNNGTMEPSNNETIQQSNNLIYTEPRQWQLANDAVLSTIYVNGTQGDGDDSAVITNAAPTACNSAVCASSVDEDVEDTSGSQPYNDADYVTNDQSETTATQGFQLDDMPASFSTMTDLNIKVRYRNLSDGNANDTLTLTARIMQSDGTTALTNATSAIVSHTGHGTDTASFNVSSPISFTLSGTNNKTVWDGAELELTWTYNTSQAADNMQIYVSAVELNGNYTPSTITVAGTFSGASHSGVPGQCNGSTANLSLRVNGGTEYTTTCSGSDGTFTFSNVVSPVAGDTITIYSTGADKANRVYVSDGTSDTGQNIYKDTVAVGDEQDGTVTNADLGDYDNDDNATNLLFTANSGALTVETGNELHLHTADTYAPGGNVTTPKLHIHTSATYSGGSETLEITGSGSGTSRPLYIDGGTFTPSSNTTKFSSTSALEVQATTYNILQLQPSAAGSPTYTLGTTTSQTITTNGALTLGDGTNPVTVAANTYNPTLSIAGNATVSTSATFNASSTTGTITGNLTINGTYTASTGLIIIRGNFDNDGVFNASTGTVSLSPTSGTKTVDADGTGAEAFYNITFGPSGGAIVQLTTAIDVDNEVQITGGTLDSNNNNISVGGNWSNTATFSAGTATVTFDGTTSSTITTGCPAYNDCSTASFYNLIINKTSATDANDNLTLENTDLQTTGTLTITDGELIQGALNVQAGGSTAVTIASAGTWTSISTGDLYLGGTFNNDGTAIFDANGTSCGDADSITISSTNTTQRNWTGSGTFSIQDISISYMTSTPAITSLSSTEGTNVGANWTIVAGCTFDLSGKIYTDDGTTEYDCSANNLTIDLELNGTPTSSTTCTSATGDFSFSSVTAGSLVTLYIDDETPEATLVLNPSGTNTTDAHLFQNAVIVRDDTASTLTPDELYTADGGDDDVKYSVSAASNGTLTLDAGFELHLWNGSTFNTSGGNINIPATASLHLDDNSTLTTDDASTFLSGNITIDSNAIMNINDGLDISSSIVNVSGTLTYSSGTPNVHMGNNSTTIGGSGTIQFYTLTVTGDTEETLTLGNAPGQAITVNNYFFIGEEGSTATIDLETYDPTLTVNGLGLEIGSSGVINASSTTPLYVNGNFYNGGVFNSGTGTVTIGGSSSILLTGCTTAGSCTNADFYNLTINKSSSSNTVTLNTNPLTTQNLLTITSGTLVQGTLHLYNAGSGISVGASGTLSNTSTGDIALAGGLANSGIVALGGTCSATDEIAITAISGTPTWSGAGTYTLNDVNIANQNASIPISAWSSTDGTGNTGSWTFEILCNGEHVSVTISAWVKPTTSITSKALFVKDEEIRLVTNASNQPLCQVFTGAWNTAATSSTALTTNTWQHVACIYNFDTGTISVYINGTQTGSDSSENNNSGLKDSNTAIQIGQDASGTYDDFQGTIDEVRLYNQALSLSDLSKLVASAPNPVAHYKLDENSGTTITDISGNSFNGTLQNAATDAWTQGKYGGALKLDGSNDYIDVGVGPTQVNTISFWVYPETTTEYFINLTSTTDYIWANNGTVTATGLTSPTIYVNGTYTSTIVANQWQHITVITDTAENASNFDIGRTQDANYLQGIIDDIRIYNYAREPIQITEDLNAGHPAGGSPVGSQVLYYKFEDDGDTSVLDSSPNNNTGTLGGDALGTDLPTWNSNSKFGKGLEFDGTNDVIVTPDSASLSPTSGISISGWIKMPDGFSTANDHNYGIVDKGAYQFYLDTSDGKAHWVLNDAAADAFKSLDSGLGDLVYALAIVNGDLVAGGIFTGTETGGTACVGCNRIAKWNGSSWTPLDHGLNSAVYSLSIYNGELVAGGAFTQVGQGSVLACDGCNRIAKWNGSSWTNLDKGLSGTVYGLTAYNGKLIAAGSFTNVGIGGISCTGCNRIAQWDGTSWSNLDSGLGSFVYALAVFDGKLIAGGLFTSVGSGGTACTGCNYIARWNGSAWTNLDDGLNNEINSLAIFEGKLLASGTFTNAGASGTTCTGCNRIAQWNGSAWTNLDSGLGARVRSLAVVNGNLFAGGDFTSVGSGGTACTGCNYIARWNGSAWTNLDKGLNNNTRALIAYKGDLHIGGDFTAVGSGGTACTGSGCNQVAKWGTDNLKSITTSTETWNPNTWYHYAASFDGTNMKLLINGSQENSAATSITIEDTSHDLYIGSMHGNSVSSSYGANVSGEFFKGTLDELKIYGFGISNETVLTEYNQGRSTQFGSLSTESDGITASNAASRKYCVPGDTSTCSAPIAEWKFDENIGSTTGDSSNNGYDGTINTATWAPGKFGNALQYNGTSSYTHIGTGPTSVKTISLWIKPATTSEYLVDLNGSAYLRVNAGTLSATGFTSPTIYVNGRVSSTVTANTWQHITITTATGINASDLDIGAYDIGGTPSYFEGVIDQITLYDYARTQAQVAWEYNQGSPVAHFKFDECSGATANDSSSNANGDSNGNHATIIPGTLGNTSVGTCTSGSSTEMWANGSSGKWNNSLDLDGTDDYLTIDRGYIGTQSSYSITTWLKVDPVSADQELYVEARSNNASDAMALGINPDGTVGYAIRPFNVGTWTEIASTATIDDSTWHQVTFVQASTTDRKIYIDGKLDTSSTASAAVLTAPDRNSLGVLRRNGALGNYFNGQLDDTRLYNYALTAQQVKTLFNNGAVNFQ